MRLGMCGYLNAAIENSTPEELNMTKGAHKVFLAVGKDLKKIGITQETQTKEITLLKSEITHVQKNLSEVKKDVASVKENIANINGKFDAMSTIVNEMSELIRDHFKPEHIKEQVIGSTILEVPKMKKFWLACVLFLLFMLLAGIGLYNLVLINPEVAKSIVAAAATSM